MLFWNAARMIARSLSRDRLYQPQNLNNNLRLWCSPGFLTSPPPLTMVLACPVWRFVHTRFQISNKEFVIISMKDISVQLELKYIQAENLKIKRSRFCGEHVLFGSHSDDWMFGFLVVALIFLLFRRLVPFLFTVFIEAFLLDLTANFFFAEITIRRCSTATAKLPANSLGYWWFSVSRHIKIKIKTVQ